MTDFIWPTSIVPSTSSWRLVANTAVFQSPLSGSTRTLGRGGDRWACSLQVNNLTDDKRNILQGFLARLRGQAHRVWIPDHSYKQRGNFNSTINSELVPYSTFNAGTTGWTTEANMTLTVADNVARATWTNIAINQVALHPASALTFVANAPYVFRALIQPAYGTTATYLRGGTTAAGVEYGDSGTGTFGLRTLALAPTGTSGYAHILAVASGSAIGDCIEVPYFSVARCCLVKGGSQTGTSLAVDGLPGSVTGILLAGDLVQIGDTTYPVAAPLNSDSGGNGFLFLGFPLRSSPADNTPVVIHQPLRRMMLADQTVGWSNEPRGRGLALSSFSCEFVEDIL